MKRLCLLLVLLVAGCGKGPSPARYPEVKIGMTTDEAIAILGAPDFRSDSTTKSAEHDLTTGLLVWGIEGGPRIAIVTDNEKVAAIEAENQKPGMQNPN